MGFFFVQNKSADKHLRGLSPDFLRRHECQVCPLNELKDLKHPKMLPTGSETPAILIIGEAPGKNEDERGIQFIGQSGKIIRSRIPKGWESKIRFTNAINCRPPENRTPDNVELQCCLPRLERDVAAAKPKAIFGFGYTPLSQIVKPDSKYARIGLWRGRKLPVTIGGHTCWFYPMFHPAYILYEGRKRKYVPEGEFSSEAEFAFELDLQRAFADMDNFLTPPPVVHTVEEATAGIEIVTDIKRIAYLLFQVGKDPSVGVDIETNCLRPYMKGAKILTVACSSGQHTFSFPVDHSQASWTTLERKQLDVLIKEFLYETNCRKIVHHLPFEQEWFAYFYGTGCLYASRWEDTESQGFLLDARRGALSLDFLCIQYFGLHLKAISGLDRKNLDKSLLKQVLKYNAIDARYHRLLYLAQLKRIKSEALENNYEHQLRRIPALVLAQLQGVPVDQLVVEDLKKKYKKQAKKVAARIEQEDVVKEFEEKKGVKFNPSSPKDVNYLIKEILGLEVPNTDKGELGHIEHPIAKMIVEWREPNKVLSTYIEPVDETSDETSVFPDGMLHPIINTCTVVSNRTSSDSPNIQNWPKRDEERKEVRGQVKHSDLDIVIVSIDYAGIQARNVAMESRDKKLVDAFWHNYDIHTEWMERIAKKAPRWIPKSKLQDKAAMKGFRHLAKNKFVFPTFFGAQAFSVSESLGIDKKVCEDLRDEFFDQFPDIHKWHQSLDKFYYENGYVTGLSEHRCRAPISPNQRINLPIQGDEAFIVMDAMARLAELEDQRYQPMLMVHDDLTFKMPKKDVEKRLEVIVKEMINVPFEWANIVPIEVEVSWGRDWINMTEIGKYSNDKWNGIVEIKGGM